MSDELSNALWVEPKRNRSGYKPEDRVETALQRALDNTTPERPGAPWDEEDKIDERPRGWVLPQGD